MDYQIRAATAKDRATVWEMLRYASHQTSVESVREQPSLARYASNWGRAGDVGCIAEQNTLHLGMAWLRIWSAKDRGYGYINDEIPELAIAVLPDYRGRGIGTNLLIQILAMAENRFPGVSLSVRSDNSVVKLYKRAGFVKVPGSETFDRVSIASYNMLKKFE